MEELRALLTDENAAGIARSLSAEELDTPFGAAVLERWLGMDAVRAALWAGGRPEATDAQAWLVARKLLPDPASLQACCDRLPDTAWKQSLLAAAGLQGAGQAPVAAIGLARQMQPGPDRTNVLQTIAYDWVGADPTAAMNWIASVTDPTLRESLTAAGAKALAATDPDLAAGWLATAVQSVGTLNDTALSIAEIWVTQDPAKAAAWVTRFPAGNTRETAVGTILYHWLRTDSDAATAWFANLPDRDAILARLSSDQAQFEQAADVL